MTRRRILAVLGLVALASAAQSLGSTSPTVGLDHIPVVVADLERAEATFRALGFALKPGRPHDNGIRNAHVKFPDASGLELVAPAEARDDLSARYLDLLRAAEGPAFMALHARDTGRLHAALRSGGYEYRHQGELTTLRHPGLSFLFVVRDNRSPTDRPEHFAHPNGAVGLTAVWIATEEGEALVRLLVHLGGRAEPRHVLAPNPVEATVVTLGAGEVVVLPVQSQVVAGRPVVGVRFAVRDLARVREVLTKVGIEHAGTGAQRILVAPTAAAHGLWLAFGE